MSMGALGGSSGGAPLPPPSIRDNETQGINESTKKFVVGMVMDTLAEVIPFTHRAYDELYKYKSEADRPSLAPLLFLRMGGTETSSDDENVQTAQQELHDSLPENVKGWIAWEMNKPFEDRDPSYVVVNNLLNSAATATTWLTNVTQSIPSDKIDQQNILKNTGLPMVALQSTTNQMNTVLNMGQNWLNAIGSNDPNYDSLTNYMTQAGALLDNLSSLKASIENGNGTADTKQNLVETAFAFDKLSASFHNVSTGNDMQILGAYLDSLATVSAAWGMEGGSPSLLIGLSTASLGLQSDASETGILNSHYSAVADALVDGVLSSATLGTRAELQELQGLYNELASLAG